MRNGRKTLEELDNPPMRCANFHRLSLVTPPNCYNCICRSGYPQYLFGDENCDKFQLLPPEGQKMLPLKKED